ncbi:MAG TPA: protein-L-isoaspartate(D-aspartate) O-methyltransferase [Thermoanaerobaculia bacterium]|nr:protein-L-isoaspartate(D-aspartate) O-methyltransferase [Acidobacteriota bacterium]OQC41724.1 MAG: Protein-L-isoaspartate O-methyltransferase [Acidobacteria bacterium ADurb.Bin051]HNU82533.1 protein-L-isoaspartate(D-aspartate) O-methyltransferase [Thermoanaerobaculia bacterium]HPA95008.1 protein-L-isoaspartate(D-aspartate) O-methyltransferase [Thermoanaerobaculia bacterium]HRR13471.1 protein-L-isoaspartate(D-aspartate) O-methyltransferase [Thermoanaerobaculia bacterium]
MSDFTLLRERMVRETIEARGVRDPRVLAAMREVPRHRFVREHLAGQAYGDHALPIGAGQTISQPFVVARMTELLEVEATHKVLEVGTGSGYQTAILARLARWVYSLELIGELAHQAIHRLRQLGISNVKIQAFDGTVGWSEVAPFDRILVAAAAPSLPRPLLDQLGPRGRLVIPEGEAQQQRLVVYERLARGVRRREADAVAFVPLLGRHGWQRGAGGERLG